jgi:hypothetical protein
MAPYFALLLASPQWKFSSRVKKKNKYIKKLKKEKEAT